LSFTCVIIAEIQYNILEAINLHVISFSVSLSMTALFICICPVVRNQTISKWNISRLYYGRCRLHNGGDFKPARYTRAVTRRYTSDRYLSFLFSHQGGVMVWRHDIVDMVGRYSVPTRTCHLTKKIFCYRLHY